MTTPKRRTRFRSLGGRLFGFKTRVLDPADDHLNPECRQSKHANCDGLSWCTKQPDEDALTECGCACHERPNDEEENHDGEHPEERR